MNKGLSVAFLVIGVILVVLGINAWQSVSSDVSSAVTGAPTTKAIVLLVVGIILGLAGLGGTFRRA